MRFKENFYYLSNTHLRRVLSQGLVVLLKKEFIIFFDMCPKKYWTDYNLHSFFIGGPGKANFLSKAEIKIRNRFIKKYISTVNRTSVFVDEYLLVSFMIYSITLLEAGNISEFERIISIKDFKQKIIFLSFVLDLAERVCSISLYYYLSDLLHGLFFPLQRKKTKNLLDKYLNLVGGYTGLNVFLKEINNELKTVSLNKVYGVTCRIVTPSGLWKERLKKQLFKRETLELDIVSFNVLYTQQYKRFEDVVVDVERFLIKKFNSKIIRDDKERGGYRGTHFYAKYKSMPIEFKIRDLRSNLSSIEKKRHRVLERIDLRYALLP